MGDTFTDRTAMRQATEQIEARHQQIHDLQASLQRQVAELAAQWQGVASHEFQRGYQTFDTEVERVKAGLETVHGQLAETIRT